MVMNAVAERMVKYNKPIPEEQDTERRSKTNGFPRVG